VSSKETLAQARAEHKTELTKLAPAPGQFDNTPPPGAEVVSYDSDGRKLLAWLIYPAARGKHPAVLYAHGGDALGAGDADDIKPFLSAGFAVMLPSWRGENGNPGSYEMCYGEIDDANNALAYLKKLPRVDGAHIYAAGHSIGGTDVMLLAEVSSDLQKVAACGGFPDMYDARSGYPDAPFADNPSERKLRSPGQWVKDLQCPLLLMYGEDDQGERIFKRQAEDMAKQAKKEAKPEVKVESFPGKDHFSALDVAVPKMVQFFQTN